MSYNLETDWWCSLESARIILPPIIEAEKITSVVDFGCGLGAWLVVALAEGVETATGVDPNPDAAMGPLKAPWSYDLTDYCDFGMRYDLAICLEVGEHLPASAADTLVDTLCGASDLILFSAATPGQGGDGHINEQPHEYWDAKFAARGRTIEHIEVTDERVASWYRNNVRLYRCS